jgi:hypothetical protein
MGIMKRLYSKVEKGEYINAAEKSFIEFQEELTKNADE